MSKFQLRCFFLPFHASFSTSKLRFLAMGFEQCCSDTNSAESKLCPRSWMMVTQTWCCDCTGSHCLTQLCQNDADLENRSNNKKIQMPGG